MPTIPKWQRKLCKRDLRHLAQNSSTGRPNLAEFKRNFAAQLASKYTCYECERIAIKLRLPL